jgi:hypothetical protein
MSLTPVSHEVFVSYARGDLECARQVVDRLCAAGIGCWIDTDRIEAGDSFADRITQAITDARVVVLILSSRAVESVWVRDEITEAKTLRRRIVPLKIEDFDVPRAWRLMLAHHQWEETFGSSRAADLDDFVERVKSQLLQEAARTTPLRIEARPIAPPVLGGVDPNDPPYVGPRPFTARMIDRFFGRQREAEDLLRLITRERLVLVYAPSGAGKSSLLNTLVGRHLEDAGYDVLLGARVGGALPPNLRAAEIANIYTFTVIYGLDASVAPRPEMRLRDYLRTLGRKPGTHARTLVLDQFEELFTQHPELFKHRSQFIDELVEALTDDHTLRVVLAMRQEFLADLEALTADVPEDLLPRRFPLRRMSPESATEAIVSPAARYATISPEVADTIVDQLRTIRVVGFDGVPVTTQGEFIEMVHLQIVCDRLWRSLPRGVTNVELQHLQAAVGEGKSLGDFVSNALNAFYEETIESVVRSAVTRDHGGYSKELIRLGCMKFITSASTRTMVQRANGRTGRLPDWIVDQLENHHLLRAEERGGQRWYELSHDNLVQMVGGKMSREVSALLFAADLLDKVLENALQENGGSLRGYFEEHGEVLAECRPFHGQAGLFADESEFVFRASLRLGRDVQEWSRRLAIDAPEVRVAVLEDALGSTIPVVRKHAVELLGVDPIDGLTPTLCALAIEDPDATVRRAAVLSIARLDQSGLYEQLARALEDPRRGRGAFDALSHLRAAADRFVRAPAFEQTYATVAGRVRRQIRRRSWWLRLQEGLPVFAFVFVPAAGLAALAAASYKWIPGIANWALCQATPSAAMGAFHGLTAGVVWAGLITLGITFYHVVFGRTQKRGSMLRPFAAVVSGAISGLISSALVVMVITGVYEYKSLVTMGWIGSANIGRAAMWRDLFVTYRFGWVYLIVGTALGIGMALMSNAVRASTAWRTFLDSQRTGMTGLRDAGVVLKQLMKIALPHAWILPVTVGLAAVLAFYVPDTTTRAAVEGIKANPGDVIRGLVADCSTQIIGAYFGICGMGLGLVVMRRGLTLEARMGER